MGSSKAIMASQIFGFVCFAIAQTALFAWVIGLREQVDRFVFLHLEIIGLLMLRHKIQSRKSVSGISGMTIIMYACVFLMRTLLPVFLYAQKLADDIPCEVTVGVFSFLLVLDISKSVFVTYKSTYQSDLDTLKASYLLPACFALCALIHPTFSYWTWHYDYVWTFNMLIDVLALMPQVVMMSRGGGKVEAPIANFVAATCIAHFGDIIHTLLIDIDVALTDPYGFVLAMSAQFVHLLLCGDFMYYYLKEKSQYGSPAHGCCRCPLMTEMTLPQEALAVVEEV